MIQLSCMDIGVYLAGILRVEHLPGWEGLRNIFGNTIHVFLPVCLSSDSVKNSSHCSLSLTGFIPIHSSPVVRDSEARSCELQLVVNSKVN